jgi:hypothetical protein
VRQDANRARCYHRQHACPQEKRTWVHNMAMRTIALLFPKSVRQTYRRSEQSNVKQSGTFYDRVDQNQSLSTNGTGVTYRRSELSVACPPSPLACWTVGRVIHKIRETCVSSHALNRVKKMKVETYVTNRFQVSVGEMRRDGLRRDGWVDGVYNEC